MTAVKGWCLLDFGGEEIWGQAPSSPRGYVSGFVATCN